jgi:hypothetical protein
MRNSVDLDYKKWKPEKLRNKIAYVEFIHLFQYNLERANEDDSIHNLKTFTECMYSDQIDYVSFEFLVFALSGLPQYNERSVVPEKALKCEFNDVFGEEKKTPIQRKHTPKYYAYANDDKPREYWEY